MHCRVLSISILLSLHNFLHGNAAPTLGVHRYAQDSKSGRDLIIAREGGGYNSAADLGLSTADRTTVVLTIRTTAAAGKAGGAGLIKEETNN